MSQETQIGNLGGGISNEDSELVDSILNDLNSHSEEPRVAQGQRPPQGGQPTQQRQELTPEQIKQIQMQRQMAMQQQQLMQQQQMAQQQMAQQQMAQQAPQQQMAQPNGKEMKVDSDSIVDQIKNESKSIILIIFLSIILNLEQVDNLFKSQASFFTTESGSLNMQAIFIKALIIGFIFYTVKTYLL